MATLAKGSQVLRSAVHQISLIAWCSIGLGHPQVSDGQYNPRTCHRVRFAIDRATPLATVLGADKANRKADLFPIGWVQPVIYWHFWAFGWQSGQGRVSKTHCPFRFQGTLIVPVSQHRGQRTLRPLIRRMMMTFMALSLSDFALNALVLFPSIGDAAYFPILNELIGPLDRLFEFITSRL